MAQLSMQTIVVATQKGGSGKSTLTIGLALAAKQAGHNVRLIDADPQQTLSNWRKRRAAAEPAVEIVDTVQDLEPRLRFHRDCGVTLTIIDTAGGVSSVRSASIRHADLCLIPVRPTIADIEATATTLGLVRAWKKPFAFVLNQTPIRGQRVDNAAHTLVDEAHFDLADTLARPFIAARNDHQDAMNAGLAVTEYAPANKAAEEIRHLWRWVENRLPIAASTRALATSPLPGMILPIRLDSPAHLS
jgi:chromosome partitioning protein